MSARSWLAMGEAAVEGLAVIDKIAHLGGAGALAAIKVALRALNEGFAGKLQPQAVLSQIEALHATLADNDAAANAELDQRFPR